VIQNWEILLAMSLDVLLSQWSVFSLVYHVWFESNDGRFDLLCVWQ